MRINLLFERVSDVAV